MNKLIVSGLAAACIAGAAPAPALAAPVERLVDNAGLDLTNSADSALLRKRMRRAAAKACRAESPVIVYYSFQSCVSDTLARAEAQVASRRSHARAVAVKSTH
ncbi:hypothetical protein B2G71_23535 [Novosphingobium sp. PC22D]|uniref:UrcA family protein n=1 Tax=Novosphingobium sp. PC22D TaxID=1962403 RepID=UPI000BF1619A|nr:UrcA family protein [Novosphingobium sp. PC22D]PEQ10212.1 hypothetical protein B2G71_23535 [Novosphingobium sp. PC22D]